VWVRVRGSWSTAGGQEDLVEPAAASVESQDALGEEDDAEGMGSTRMVVIVRSSQIPRRIP